MERSFGLGEVFVYYNFIQLFGLDVIAGRNFSTDFPTDAGLRENGRLREVTALLNEDAVRRFG